MTTTHDLATRGDLLHELRKAERRIKELEAELMHSRDWLTYSRDSVAARIHGINVALGVESLKEDDDD